MAHFRCLIRGEGFMGILEGRDGTMGFYVNRPVEAVDAVQARRQPARLPPKLAPLRHARRSDLKCGRYLADRIARTSPQQRTFTKVFRIRSRHPCWPRSPSTELESEITRFGSPDFFKK
jgi:hypothetical protein